MAAFAPALTPMLATPPARVFAATNMLVLVLLLLASALSANVTALRLNMMKMVCFYLKKFDTSRSLLFLCFLRFTTEKSFEKKNERVHFYARA